MHIEQINRLRKIAGWLEDGLRWGENNVIKPAVGFIGNVAGWDHRDTNNDGISASTYLGIFGPSDASALRDLQQLLGDNAFKREDGSFDAGKFITDARTLPLLYRLGKIEQSNWDEYNNQVRNWLHNQYIAYTQGYDRENPGQTPQDEASWQRDHAQRFYPLYAYGDMLRAAASMVDESTTELGADPVYTARGGWNRHLAQLANSPFAQFFTGGNPDIAGFAAAAKNNPEGARIFLGGLQALRTDDNLRWLTTTAGSPFAGLGEGGQYAATIQHAYDLFSSDLMKNHYPHIVELTGQSDDDTIDDTEFFNPKYRAAIDALSSFTQDQRRMDALAALDPDTYRKLSADAGRLQWATANRGALTQMRDFQTNPLAYLLTSFFNRDPSDLYRVIDNIGRIYDPDLENNPADGKWYQYLAAGNSNMQQYAKYLPWLRLIANIRSWLGGTGTRYE